AAEKVHVGLGEISLPRQSIAALQGFRPAAEEVAAGHALVAFEHLVQAALVRIALQGNFAAAPAPVGAKACLSTVPAVGAIRAIRVLGVVVVESLAVEADMAGLTQACAVAKSRILAQVAIAECHEAALGI